MTKNSISKLCTVAAALLVPTLTYAGTTSVKPSKQPVEQIKESAISADLGVNVVSEYILRGVVQENQGVIAQPFADFYFRLYQGDGFVNKVSLNLGLWSSIHDHNARTGTTQNWFEFDYTVGLAVTFLKDFTATLSYLEYLSPNDSFTTSRNLNLNLAYDDTDLLGAFALHPHVAVLAEVGGPGYSGIASAGRKNGWYYEAGIAPSYSPCEGLTLSLPLNVGLGDDRYYAGDTYGYFSAGLTATMPLSFIPQAYGVWTANAGYTYYNLGDEAAKTDTRNDESHHVFQAGVTVAF